MKTTLRTLSAAFLAALFALASCDKSDIAVGGGIQQQTGGSRVIAVSFQNNTTKTVLDGLQPKFVATDVIKVSNGSATEDCPVDIDDSGNASITTELTGALTMVYPAAAWSDTEPYFKVSTVQDGTFASANICKAIIAEKATEASFENQTAVLRFYVDASIGVKSITVTSSTSDIATGAKTITVDPAGDVTLNTVTDGPDKRLCYVSVLSGVNASTLTLTSETTTQGTVTRPKPMADVELTTGTMYNAFIPYYIKIKVSDSPETYQKLAYCNVGAFLPEDYGEYFAWGETTGHKANSEKTGFEDGHIFNWNNCPYQTVPNITSNTNTSSPKFTKYLGGLSSSNRDPSATVEDASKTVLDPEDDAAHVNWQGSWRMPTKEEFVAMMAATYWAWDATDKGYYVYAPNPATDAGKVNEKGTGTYIKADALLFFPAVGTTGSDKISGPGEKGYYWSSSLYGNSTYYFPHSAISMYFSSSTKVNTPANFCRLFGRAVRPLSD